MDKNYRFMVGDRVAGSATLVQDDEDTWYIAGLDVWSPWRRRGIARFLMTQICADADRERKALELFAASMDRRDGPSSRELEEFYRSLGFQDTDDINMRREPREDTSAGVHRAHDLRGQAA